MRLTLRQLQIFLAIADAGSTTAAAEAIALSQSATSAALNELESALAVCLFDRVGKRLLINASGRHLLPQARLLLDGARTIEQEFTGGASTALRIGCSTTIGIYLLPKILAALTTGDQPQNPRVRIANTADIAAAVADFEVDVGLIEGSCDGTDMTVTPWLADELIVTCAPSHRLAGGRSSLKQLRRAEWLLREPGSGTREAVEHALLPHLDALVCAGEFSNSESIKHAAAAGLGLACLSRVVVADFIASGRLVALNTALPPLRRRFYIIHRQHKLLSAGLSRFIAFCHGWPGA
jgi:DNA-binding transcriptional LysR family regulator